MALVVWVTQARRAAGGAARLGAANRITVVRFLLIAPTAWLLFHDRFHAAAVCYGLLLASDVADGVVARRLRDASAVGVFLDPLADVLSTLAVFTAFVTHSLIPVWLYALLVARYAMLAFGSLILTRISGPIEYHATVPGKIVGVVQAGGALWIMLWAGRGDGAVPGDGPLFAFLAFGFLSIVVSQTVIGYRHVRRASRRV